MTIEEILQMDAATLEKMSTAELTEHFKKYFPITRPDQCVKPVGHNPSAPKVNPMLAKGIAMLKQHGVEGLEIFETKLTRKK